MSIIDDVKKGIDTIRNTRWRTTSDEEKNPTPLPKRAVKVQKTTVTSTPDYSIGPDMDQVNNANGTKSSASDIAAGGHGAYLKKGGKVSSASSRADGCAKRGKTKGRLV